MTFGRIDTHRERLYLFTFSRPFFSPMRSVELAQKYTSLRGELKNPSRSFCAAGNLRSLPLSTKWLFTADMKTSSPVACGSWPVPTGQAPPLRGHHTKPSAHSCVKKTSSSTQVLRAAWPGTLTSAREQAIPGRLPHCSSMSRASRSHLRFRFFSAVHTVLGPGTVLYCSVPWWGSHISPRSQWPSVPCGTHRFWPVYKAALSPRSLGQRDSY